MHRFQDTICLPSDELALHLVQQVRYVPNLKHTEYRSRTRILPRRCTATVLSLFSSLPLSSLRCAWNTTKSSDLGPTLADPFTTGFGTCSFLGRSIKEPMYSTILFLVEEQDSGPKSSLAMIGVAIDRASSWERRRQRRAGHTCITPPSILDHHHPEALETMELARQYNSLAER